MKQLTKFFIEPTYNLDAAKNLEVSFFSICLVCLGILNKIELVVGVYVCVGVGILVNCQWCDHFGAMAGIWGVSHFFEQNVLETSGVIKLYQLHDIQVA